MATFRILFRDAKNLATVRKFNLILLWAINFSFPITSAVFLSLLTWKLNEMIFLKGIIIEIYESNME